MELKKQQFYSFGGAINRDTGRIGMPKPQYSLQQVTFLAV
jgi:hypothetical protein